MNDEEKRALEYRIGKVLERMKKKQDSYSFKCQTCGTVHSFHVDAVAQMAMGHTLTHTCKCGAKHRVAHFKASQIQTGKK